MRTGRANLTLENRIDLKELKKYLIVILFFNVFEEKKTKSADQKCFSSLLSKCAIFFFAVYKGLQVRYPNSL